MLFTWAGIGFLALNLCQNMVLKGRDNGSHLQGKILLGYSAWIFFSPSSQRNDNNAFLMTAAMNANLCSLENEGRKEQRWMDQI